MLWPLLGTWSMPVILRRGRRGRSSCGSRERSCWTGSAATTPSSTRREEESSESQPCYLRPCCSQICLLRRRGRQKYIQCSCQILYLSERTRNHHFCQNECEFLCIQVRRNRQLSHLNRISLSLVSGWDMCSQHPSFCRYSTWWRRQTIT